MKNKQQWRLESFPEQVKVNKSRYIFAKENNNLHTGFHCVLTDGYHSYLQVLPDEIIPEESEFADTSPTEPITKTGMNILQSSI